MVRGKDSGNSKKLTCCFSVGKIEKWPSIVECCELEKVTGKGKSISQPKHGVGPHPGYKYYDTTYSIIQLGKRDIELIGGSKMLRRLKG